MDRSGQPPHNKSVSDQYGNQHCLTEELARGGQGVVFRTKDADLAVKQPLNASGFPDKDADLRDRFQNVRLLPIPHRIQISLPLAILRDEPGYVMRLLGGMRPFEDFLSGKTYEKLKDPKLVLPQWLTKNPGKDTGLLFHYADTGSTRRRLFALSKCAAILARLHNAGLVYGDISPNNTFIGEGSSREVWLIDADNLRFELPNGGSTFYTPVYCAPEIVRGTDSSRAQTDCWAFSAMAFKILVLCHPFIGKKVSHPEDDEGGWDAEPVADGTPVDLHKQAYAGYLPFGDDENNDSNRLSDGLPREWVLTPKLRLLFQETFVEGKERPYRRPTMGFWALELAKAFDHSLECPECKMSYFADDHKKCPYCGALRPRFIRAMTPRWKIVIPGSATDFRLPHRLFHPFSLEHNDDTAYEAVVEKTVFPARGEKAFPENLVFEVVEGEQ